MGRKIPEGVVTGGTWDSDLASYARAKFQEMPAETQGQLLKNAKRIVSAVPGLGIDRALGLLMLLVIDFERKGKYAQIQEG